MKKTEQELRNTYYNEIRKLEELLKRSLSCWDNVQTGKQSKQNV